MWCFVRILRANFILYICVKCSLNSNSLTIMLPLLCYTSKYVIKSITHISILLLLFCSLCKLKIVSFLHYTLQLKNYYHQQKCFWLNSWHFIPLMPSSGLFMFDVHIYILYTFNLNCLFNVEANMKPQNISVVVSASSELHTCVLRFMGEMVC